MSSSYDDLKIIERLDTGGKDGKICLVESKRGKQMIAKFFRKNKNYADIENEFTFSKMGQKLKISPKVYGLKNDKNGSNYILLEKLDKTLFKQLEKHHKLTINQQKQIIEILEILDDNNIFHGDISPLNFMFDSNGTMMIIDYGMSYKIDKRFRAKHGNHPNIKLGLSVFILKIREFLPDFEPKLLLKKIYSRLKLN